VVGFLIFVCIFSCLLHLIVSGPTGAVDCLTLKRLVSDIDLLLMSCALPYLLIYSLSVWDNGDAPISYSMALVRVLYSFPTKLGTNYKFTLVRIELATLLLCYSTAEKIHCHQSQFTETDSCQYLTGLLLSYVESYSFIVCWRRFGNSQRACKHWRSERIVASAPVSSATDNVLAKWTAVDILCYFYRFA